MDLFENDFRKQILLTKIVIENYRIYLFRN